MPNRTFWLTDPDAGAKTLKRDCPAKTDVW